MPFTCDIRVEPSQLEHGPLVFDDWIEAPWGQYMPGGTPFARVHDEAGEYVVELRGPGVLCEKGKLQSGDTIETGARIARYQTDGEDIIYDGPACTIRRR